VKRAVAQLDENFDEMLAKVTAPVELGKPSGEWISTREAKAIVEKLTDGDQGQAIAAICRRAVIAVPVRASTYSRGEDPHDYIDRLDFFADREVDLSHFRQTLTQNAFAEIRGFFALVGDAPWDNYDGFTNGVEYAVWATGDFKAKVQMDFSDVTLTVLGLQFDRKALLSSFGEEPQPTETPAIAVGSNGGGRPRKYDWEGAMIHMAALANHPDGLPTGPGAQAKIARRIADWFESGGGDCPADSEIRRRASRIVQALTAN
jgi:hypothetical protein